MRCEAKMDGWEDAPTNAGERELKVLFHGIKVHRFTSSAWIHSSVIGITLLQMVR